MYAAFNFAANHQALVWALFLLPLFAVFHRGLVLDKRADRFDTPVSYGVLFYLGFMPLVNVPVAAWFTVQSIIEFRS